jgi:hypothetical protein
LLAIFAQPLVVLLDRFVSRLQTGGLRHLRHTGTNGGIGPF